MHYRTYWLYSKRVMKLEIEGDISLEDLAGLDSEIRGHLDEGTAPVHLISEVYKLGHVPVNIMRIKNVVNYVKHPNLGWHLIVNRQPHSLTMFLASVATQAAGVKMHYVGSTSEAVEALRRIDLTLENISESDFQAPPTNSSLAPPPTTDKPTA